MRKLFLATIGMVLGVGGAFAGDGSSTAGFLNLPSSSRLAGLGEAGLALVDGSQGLGVNPASLGRFKGQGVGLTHGIYVDESALEDLTYARATKAGAFGVGVRYFSAGKIDELDTTGATVGSFTPSDLALTAGYGRALKYLKVGGAVKYIRSKLVDSASTITLDLGIESRPLLQKKLRLALVGQNLIGSLKYETEKSDLPRMIRAGGTYSVKDPWDVALDFGFPKDGDTEWSLGTEYRLRMAEPWGVALRTGYNSRRADVSGGEGFALGLGVKRNKMTVDYAYVPFGDIGSTHWITIGWAW
ncbi:MAG: PorV/PorQ family protein [Elusimicrobia bacterium]|nr:PorV/PorQ family protein [Elusimicrobiota bacterium]